MIVFMNEREQGSSAEGDMYLTSSRTHRDFESVYKVLNGREGLFKADLQFKKPLSADLRSKGECTHERNDVQTKVSFSQNINIGEKDNQHERACRKFCADFRTC